MKRAITAFLLLFTILLCVGCSEKEERVVALEVCEEFTEAVTYVGEEVDFEAYTLTVTFTSGEKETIPLSEAKITGLDTTKAGEQELEIRYKGKTINIIFMVHEIKAIAGTYKGQELELYAGEDLDIKGKYITVLYTNGDEKEVELTEAELGEVDHVVDGKSKYLKATYEGIQVNLPYKVAYRMIEEGKRYEFVDKFQEKVGYQIEIQEGKATLYKDGIVKEVISVNKGEGNRYIGNRFINGKITQVEYYLYGGILYCKAL